MKKLHNSPGNLHVLAETGLLEPPAAVGFAR